MNVLAWIVLGLLAGMIAKAIMPGDDPGGLIVTTIIGIVGAVIGGFIATRLLNLGGVDSFFDLSTWLCAIAGSLILLLAYRLVAGGRSSGGPAV